MWDKNFQCFSIKKKLWSYELETNFAIFLPLILNLPKWPWLLIIKHPLVISSLCVKEELLKHFLQKDMKATQIWHLFCKWPRTCPNDLGSSHDTTSGYKKFLCEVWTSNASSYVRYGSGTNIHFSFQCLKICLNDLQLKFCHILSSYAFFVWSINFKGFSIRKIWTGYGFLPFSAQWPSTYPDYLRSKSCFALSS